MWLIALRWCYTGQFLLRFVSQRHCDTSSIATQVPLWHKFHCGTSSKAIVSFNMRILCYATQQVLTSQPFKRSLQFSMVSKYFLYYQMSKILPLHHFLRSFPPLPFLELKHTAPAPDVRLRCRLQKASVTWCNGYKNASNLCKKYNRLLRCIV